MPAPDRRLPIIGIGASAGGLEALEQFLSHVPADSGLAIVIIQHLDPNRPGLMPELLQRTTTLKVTQVTDRLRVRPDCVYVIPPNKDMSILQGVLHLMEPGEPRGRRLPIDYFLRSLAQDQREGSIGVILSGMGADGTLGLRAIKEQGGLVLVQESATAKFDSMPRSAIEAGLADIVAPAAELPGRIIAYLAHTPAPHRGDASLPEPTENALEKVVILLRAHTGHDFSHYKRNTLQRRIERRMGLHQLATMADYVRYLQANAQELDLLFKELLIGVTNFFRDTAAWAQLRDEALPALLASRPAGHTLRAWVPGCSTGEEAYSLAMALKAAVEAFRPQGPFAIQVFATDLDRDAIDRARHGLYPESVCADVPPELLSRFFTPEPHGCRVRKEIRELVIFAPQNLIMDPPFTKLDLLSCRNLLIYLSPEVQKKLIPLFHYSLTPGGLLFLGSAETIGSATDLFTPLSGKSRIFQRAEPPSPPGPVEFPPTFSARLRGPGESPPPPPAASLQSTADKLVLQRYAPPAVLVNDQGDILYISGRIGRYLEPAAGKANWNLFAMAREGLRYELADAFHRALREPELVAVPDLRVGPPGEEHAVALTVQRLTEPGPLLGLVMIVFLELTMPAGAAPAGTLPAAHAKGAHQAALEKELLKIRAEARNTREAMQTAQEELRSTNEELQSTNEELQSANEELTTSKEEIQSMNEELRSTNEELQQKLEQLSRASDDMKNLLNSTDIATLFLDRELHVRRFTPSATRIIKLITGDVGRPVTDLASELRYPELADDAREVLRRLTPVEKSIAAHDGRWVTVRLMPYRTTDDHIDGVVITFADITVAKQLEARLRDRLPEPAPPAPPRKTGRAPRKATP